MSKIKFIAKWIIEIKISKLDYESGLQRQGHIWLDPRKDKQYKK